MVEEDHRRLPAETLFDLSPDVKKLLDELRPEEVEALRAVARMGPDGIELLLDVIRNWTAVMTVARFVRRVIVLVMGLFVGMLLLARQISEAWQWVKMNVLS